jgi:hypothetical protein
MLSLIISYISDTSRKYEEVPTAATEVLSNQPEQQTCINCHHRCAIRHERWPMMGCEHKTALANIPHSLRSEVQSKRNNESINTAAADIYCQDGPHYPQP